MRYLLAPVAALLCAASIVLPAAAGPKSSASITMTCERGSGATATVTLYREGTIVGHAQGLSCGLASPTGARSARARVKVTAAPDSVGYHVELAYPGQPQPGCNAFTAFPGKLSCPVENWNGPAVNLAAR